MSMPTPAAAPVPATAVDANKSYAELAKQYGLVFGELLHLRLVAAAQEEELRYLRSLQQSPALDTAPEG